MRASTLERIDNLSTVILRNILQRKKQNTDSYEQAYSDSMHHNKQNICL